LDSRLVTKRHEIKSFICLYLFYCIVILFIIDEYDSNIFL